MRIFNSLTRNKEEFIPLDMNNIGLYVCGPTVYDRAHIGNARSVVIFDCLYRVLKRQYNTKYVRNITDVDDKINNAAKERNISIYDLTDQTIRMFHSDMDYLNCLRPDIEPKATDHINEMLSLIDMIIENGHGYEADGHVLFDVESFEKYGQLSNRKLSELIDGARIEVESYKKNAGDFVMWKPSEHGWDSKYGKGMPGWHIECSAMSSKYLSENFDIHGGGADLQFPHHENEIAQSQSAHPGSSYANYWVHNGFLTVNGEKMSKSLGNFITVKDLIDKNIKGETIRVALLSSHYRKPLDWNDNLLNSAQKLLNNIYKSIDNHIYEENIDENIFNSFIECLEDDLNTPKAISIIHQLTNKENPIVKNTLIKIAKFFGIANLSSEEWFQNSISKEEENKIEELIEKRKIARSNKDWTESDRIRDILAQSNIILEDTPEGTIWKKT